MKKKIMSATDSAKKESQNMLNPQVLQMISSLMQNKNNANAQKTSKESEEVPAKQTENTEKKSFAQTSMDTENQIGLIYNNQLVDIIKKHDKRLRRIVKNLPKE